MYLYLINEGSHRIDNLEIATYLPLGWIKQIEPDVIGQLAVGDEEKTTQFLSPRMISFVLAKLLILSGL